MKPRVDALTNRLRVLVSDDAHTLGAKSIFYHELMNFNKFFFLQSPITYNYEHQFWVVE